MDREKWARLQRTLQQQGRQGFGGNTPPLPKGLGGLAGALVAVFGGGYLISYSLFNGMFLRESYGLILSCFVIDWWKPNLVDGGHRAIKYTRIGGVRPEVYNEGIQMPQRDQKYSMFIINVDVRLK